MRKIALLAIAFLVVATSFAAPAVFAASRQTSTNTVAQARSDTTKTAEKKEVETKETKKAEEPKPVMVTVKEGDSLSLIATEHESTWVRIYNANESIANPDMINPGQELRVPRADEELTERTLPEVVVAAAPVQTQAPTSASYASYARSAPTSYPAVSGNEAKAFIYSRESGNNPNATNPTGCYGLGQDCNGVLRSQCGADYGCQDAFFDGYAARRYGSWQGAYQFWIANGWW